MTNRLTTRGSHSMPGRWATGSTLLMSIAIGLQLASMTWQAWPVRPAGDPTSAIQRSIPVELAAQSPAHAISPDLFGQLPRRVATKPARKPAPPKSVATAPKPALKLLLRGVAATAIPESAIAILETPDRKSDIYRIGASVPGGGTLVEIKATHVVIERDGQRAQLDFDGGAPKGSSTTAHAPSKVSTTPVRATAPEPAPVTTSSHGRSHEQRQLSPAAKTRLRDYLQVLPSDPMRLIEVVRVTPVTIDGQLQGFRLFPGKDRALFAAIGLQRGDIVTSVNGVAITNPAEGLKLLQSLPDAQSLLIDFQRHGRERTVQLNL